MQLYQSRCIGSLRVSQRPLIPLKQIITIPKRQPEAFGLPIARSCSLHSLVPQQLTISFCSSFASRQALPPHPR
jgi:hypothetical protein